MHVLLLSEGSGFHPPVPHDEQIGTEIGFLMGNQDLIHDILPEERKRVMVLAHACRAYGEEVPSYQKKRQAIEDLMTKTFGFEEVIFMDTANDLPPEPNPEQDLLFIPGGNAWNLNAAGHHKRLHNLIRALITQGIPCIAGSAGTVLMGTKTLSTNEAPNESSIYYPALALLPVLFNTEFPGPLNFPEANTQRQEKLNALRDGRFLSHQTRGEGDGWQDGDYTLEESTTLAELPHSLEPIVCLPNNSALLIREDEIIFYEQGFFEEKTGLEIKRSDGSSTQYADGDDLTFLLRRNPF